MGKRDEFEHDAEIDPAGAGEPTENSDSGDDHSGEGGQEESVTIEEMTEHLSAAEQKAQEHYERMLRVSADFENYKKRTAREMKDLAKYANEKIAKELLLVVDNLERAIESASERCTPEDPLLMGVQMTLQDTLKLLERHQVVPIQSLGQSFDPKYHQAMLQMEVKDQPSNTVVKELQKGYMIHDRLLRPSLVAVSTGDGRNKNESASSENGSTD